MLTWMQSTCQPLKYDNPKAIRLILSTASRTVTSIETTHFKMSLYSSNSLFPTSMIPIPNGIASQMDEKPKNKIVYLDVTPARTPNMKPYSPNAVIPLNNNLVDPQISRDIIYENIKPVFSILRIMGVLPITRPKPGISQFLIASPAMAYSAIVYISLVSYVLYLSLNKLQIRRTAEGKFEEAVIEYLFTVYLFPMIAVPIMWYETRKIAGVLNSWVDFELMYRQMSSRPLPIKMYKKSLAIAIIIPALSTASVIITHVTMVHFKLIQIIPYIFLEILTYILGGYWYLLCDILSVSANILAEDFQQALRHIGPAGKVAEYRAMWLRLSKIARDTGISNCYTFTFVNLYLFLIITLSIYGLLSQISEGFGIKDIGLAVTALCSIFLLFFICDEAHQASHNVRTIFQKKLLMVELSWMNADAQTEVNMFLRATEMNPSQISLGGFFDVNRTLFKSLMATMVTYLVVLLQFQISIPDENQGQGGEYEESAANVTSAVTEVMTTTTTVATTVLTTLAKKKKNKH
ncbi:gustatory and odorant receptor 24 [Plodia interpunctella]|uniref:gustatory and odorant receptor 24 n=1 Tax=Plodia interpunctella TaxID=58824 RepID=UPI0023677DBB|nr:gustatory and odorant receptor 24 [Plodia interpunctella]XP_053615597.1 gustatory and odorant receptor 24 [Plodia interpunctella]